MNIQSSAKPKCDVGALSKLQQTALTIFKNGHVPVRLNYKEKRPGHNDWLASPPTEQSIISDFKRASNIGLIQGVVGEDKTFPVAIDVDVDNGALTSYIENVIGEDCPKKRGKKGMTFLVRAIGDVPSRPIHLYHGGKKKHAIDILAKGKQTVIPPSVHPDTDLPYTWYGDLTPLNTKSRDLPLIDEAAIDEITAFCKDANNKIALLNEMIWNGVGGGGDTHDTSIAAVASMVSRGWSDDQIHARIRRAKREACERAGEAYHWPNEVKVCQEWIDSAREKDFGTKKSKTRPSHGDLADLVLSNHGGMIKRDKGRRDWCVYNGKIWEEGATEEVKTLVRQSLSNDQVFGHTINGVEAVLRLYPSAGVKNDVWDRDKHYLNCPDGTYDLKTREMLPHDPKHYITKITEVSPRFDYQNSRWVEAISTWFGGDAVEIEYIQTLFGLFLTGETKDECVSMWIGKSGAGKTKMTEIMGYIMGEYAQTATDTAFLEVRYHPHQEEVARMRGKRLVFIHEVEGHLNLRRVKSIASGESTSASLKGKDSFQFNPEAKIWFVGNQAPPTKSAGGELQRRFHVYEFEREIDKKDVDRNLGAKLRAEAEYVLGWAIDGAVKYYKNGLKRSPHVKESTNRYFADADIIEQWIEECCIVDKLEISPIRVLFESFDGWADDARIRAKPDKGRFSQRLKANGYSLSRKVLLKGKSSVRVAEGLRLRIDDELLGRSEGEKDAKF